MIKKILLLILVICIFSGEVLALPSISVDYPQEVIIERGWIKYFNVVVTNNGDDLHNVMISFSGENPQWLEIETNQTELLQMGENASFLVKISVPNSADSRAYPLNLNINSREVSDSKTFSVRVFNSESDMLLYQVQQLENEIEEVKMNATVFKNSGKNVTGVESTLEEAQGYLNDSKIYIDNGNYEKVTSLIINAGDSINKAAYDLSVLSSSTEDSNPISSFPFEVLIAPVAIALFVVIFYFGFKRKKRVYAIQPAAQSTAQSAAKIKEFMLEGKDIGDTENELKEAENSLNLLEDEFKENLISKESHDELKVKYEKKISELREKIEKNRKI